MHKATRLALLAVLVVGIGGAAGTTPADAAAAKHYKNCKALNARYPHGVGLSGAHDHTSGKPVTTFKRSRALYKANTSLDRDKDHIACEKR
jgi:hypothetical protein